MTQPIKSQNSTLSIKRTLMGKLAADCRNFIYCAHFEENVQQLSKSGPFQNSASFEGFLTLHSVSWHYNSIALLPPRPSFHLNRTIYKSRSHVNEIWPIYPHYFLRKLSIGFADWTICFREMFQQQKIASSQTIFHQIHGPINSNARLLLLF